MFIIHKISSVVLTCVFEESWVCQQTIVYTERKRSNDPGLKQEHFKMRCNQALSNG